jgi:hypothetical protein
MSISPYPLSNTRPCLPINKGCNDADSLSEFNDVFDLGGRSNPTFQEACMPQYNSMKAVFLHTVQKALKSSPNVHLQNPI